jgi:hypothetical protein
MTDDFSYKHLSLRECYQQLEFNASMLVIHPDDVDYRLQCFQGLLNRMKFLRLQKQGKN